MMSKTVTLHSDPLHKDVHFFTNKVTDKIPVKHNLNDSLVSLTEIYNKI